DNERLQVEKRAQATPLRVEKLAKEQLKMRTTTPAITQYVTYRADTPAAKASAPVEGRP
ncbi:MAG: cell division protein FtsL, partial [Xylophilus sp.]|nr:cell division protein FtsL [Xylophilus sp.]